MGYGIGRSEGVAFSEERVKTRPGGHPQALGRSSILQRCDRRVCDRRPWNIPIGRSRSHFRFTVNPNVYRRNASPLPKILDESGKSIAPATHPTLRRGEAFGQTTSKSSDDHRSHPKGFAQPRPTFATHDQPQTPNIDRPWNIPPSGPSIAISDSVPIQTFIAAMLLPYNPLSIIHQKSSANPRFYRIT